MAHPAGMPEEAFIGMADEVCLPACQRVCAATTCAHLRLWNKRHGYACVSQRPVAEAGHGHAQGCGPLTSRKRLVADETVADEADACGNRAVKQKGWLQMRGLQMRGLEMRRMHVAPEQSSERLVADEADADEAVADEVDACGTRAVRLRNNAAEAFTSRPHPPSQVCELPRMVARAFFQRHATTELLPKKTFLDFWLPRKLQTAPAADRVFHVLKQDNQDVGASAARGCVCVAQPHGRRRGVGDSQLQWNTWCPCAGAHTYQDKVPVWGGLS